MWEHLGTYDQIFRGFVISLMAGTNILVAYALVAIPMNAHIKSLEDYICSKVE